MSPGECTSIYTRRLSKHKSLLLLAVPLVLSAYIHLWNPAGFPYLVEDEATYTKRAVGVLEGQLLYGLYDHPFLGQIVLAGFMHATGYMDFVGTSADPSSLEALHGIPRLFMGLLAVLDTLLIYKIAEGRFGRRAAVIASVLFAVMPLSLTLRMVLLDSILLPFVLASVLLAMHARGAGPKGGRPVTEAGSGGGGAAGKSLTAARHAGAGRSARTPSPALTRARLLIAMSGACMGCAVLVKVPSVAMIPLVLALAYSANRSPRQALLWLVPAVLVAAVWPASAMMAGELDLWTDGVLWQADRGNQDVLNRISQYVPVLLVEGQDPDVLVHPMLLLGAVAQMFDLDPVLVALGAAGLAFAAVTRDRFLLAWAAPVLLFFGSVGWVSYFHLGMLWTAMCVAAAALIGAGMARMPAGGRPARDLALLAVVLAIVAFGMSTSGAIVHWNANSWYVDALSLALREYGIQDTAVILPHTAALSLNPRDSDRTDLVMSSWRPAKTDSMTLVVSSDYTDRIRGIVTARPGHYSADPAVPPEADWRSIYLEIYDAGTPVAEFRDRPAPDMPSLLGVSGHLYSNTDAEVVRWVPPEWALLPTYAPAGRALDLGGSSYVTLEGGADLDFEHTDPFSIAFWIKKDGGPASTIMSKSDAVTHQGIRVHVYDTGSISLGITDDSSRNITVSSFHSIADGHWHRVVFTYDGSGTTNGLGVYVDGRSDNLRWHDTHLGGSVQNGRPLVMGAGGAGAGFAQDTLLDGMMIYSEALSANHIGAMHECHREGAIMLATDGPASRSGPACGSSRDGSLLAHLEFEGDLSDSSGNGNGGTARGDVRYA